MPVRYCNYYEILGVSPKAVREEIKEAFRRQTLIHHPDKHNNSEISNRRFRIILNAYGILSIEEKRREYDDFLKRSRYLRRRENKNSLRLTGETSPSRTVLLDYISIILWEIDDLLAGNTSPDYRTPYLLIILTFLDKWILGPSGFPDYFSLARKMASPDPREYIHLLSGPPVNRGHMPYYSFQDYYYDIRKRTDRFLSSRRTEIRTGLPAGYPPLEESILEFHNLAVHYLGYLLNENKSTGAKIPEYSFSKEIYFYKDPSPQDA